MHYSCLVMVLFWSWSCLDLYWSWSCFVHGLVLILDLYWSWFSWSWSSWSKSPWSLSKSLVFCNLIPKWKWLQKHAWTLDNQSSFCCKVGANASRLSMVSWSNAGVSKCRLCRRWGNLAHKNTSNLRCISIFWTYPVEFEMGKHLLNLPLLALTKRPETDLWLSDISGGSFLFEQNSVLYNFFQ